MLCPLKNSPKSVHNIFDNFASGEEIRNRWKHDVLQHKCYLMRRSRTIIHMAWKYGNFLALLH